MLDLLAQQLGKLPNKISVEGHTDSTAYSRNSDYGNWELSADRANSARRLMQKMGLGAQQVTQIRGYADQRLRKPEAPLDPSNRRISVIVQYVEKSGTEKEKPAESTGEKPPAGTPPSADLPKDLPKKE